MRAGALPDQFQMILRIRMSSFPREFSRSRYLLNFIFFFFFYSLVKMHRKTLSSDLTRREYRARLQGIQESIPETESLEGVNLKKHGVVEMPLALDAQAGENPDSLFFIPLTSDILEKHPVDPEFIRKNPSLGTYTDFDPEELKPAGD